VCLALIALDAHPRYALVIAANRDEFHARAAAPAAWWDEGWLAGRDLKAGGTWFGVTRSARWAFVTNVRDSSRVDPGAPSRGALVPAALSDATPPSACVERLVAAARSCNGFNLVVGDASTASWGSNRAVASRPLARGIHGLSNAALDVPWPKVERTTAALRAWCAGGDADIAPIFAMLGDTARAADHELPATGVSLERERLLSAPFIVSATYGTRCATVITVGRDGDARFVERTFGADGRALADVRHRFAVSD
jgi:uncharacterized protein with NRDE domain